MRTLPIDDEICSSWILRSSENYPGSSSFYRWLRDKQFSNEKLAICMDKFSWWWHPNHQDAAFDFLVERRNSLLKLWTEID